MSTISQQTQELINKYKEWWSSIQPKENPSPTVHVDEIAAGVASFYERIRGIIEWREEHLLRKTAIERIFRRRLLLKKEGEKIAGFLTLELVRGGHFKNDSIPETKVEEVQRSVDKYTLILEKSVSKTDQEKEILQKWIMGIAACEIEAILDPPIKQEALIDYMTELMKDRIVINEGPLVISGMQESEKYIQIYIACQRALFKLDNSLIIYYILKRKYPDWLKLPQLDIEEITANISTLKNAIEKALFHPWSDRFYNVCEKYDTPYLILGDILEKNPSGAEETIANPEALETAIKDAYGERFAKLKKRLNRAAVYSTLSIFLTKIFAAFLIEVPVDRYITHAFDYQVLGINIIFPPLLMLFLVVTIKPPKPQNLQRVIMETIKIAYETEKKDSYEVRSPAKRNRLISSIISSIYIITFLGTYGGIIAILSSLNFGLISMAIFLLFFSLISYAGVKIRQRARELTIDDEKETFLSSIFDFFSLPIIRMGKWFSAQWEKYNTLVIILNSLVDMPFQVFIEFLEQWRYFLKEKKEEIH